MIKQYVEGYNFDNVKFSENFVYSENGFVLKLRLKKLPAKNGSILHIGDSINVTQRMITAEDAKSFKNYEKGECYFQKTDENGYVPAVEVELGFLNEEHPEWKTMKLGINTLMYDIIRNDLYIVYDGINFRFVYDGNVINNNLTFGVLKKSEAAPEIDFEYVDNAEFSNDKAEFLRKINIVDKKLNYYTPFGHNVFIGDVVNFYHDGVYHMLYMPDRHHHGNRWGQGGHRFEHMITRDFADWEDVGPIWDVEEQWQSTGTGTMFFHNGKYYSVYGLHTSRTIPEDKVGSKIIKEYFEKNGETRTVSFDELSEKGLYPGGASYSVSDDGIHFTSGGKIFSACENPSVYSNGNELIMYAGYGDCTAWGAKDIDSPWKIIEDIKFSDGENSPMRNSSECPSTFEWNGYKYLIMGVTGFWRTEKNSDEYIERASKGYDVYEGLSVPMASKISDNRAVIAGWIGGMGWGSMVVHRELVQYEDGNLGMKWIPEMFPKITNERDFCGEISMKKGKSYYLEAELEPSHKSEYNIHFIADNGKTCELKLDLNKNTAQYGTCSEGETAEEILPMYKAINTVEQTNCGFNIGPDTLPHKCGDFSIAHVRYPNGTIKVRVMIYAFTKNNGTVIDTEIAGTRTLITNRAAFVPTKITADGEFKNLKLFEADL